MNENRNTNGFFSSPTTLSLCLQKTYEISNESSRLTKIRENVIDTNSIRHDKSACKRESSMPLATARIGKTLKSIRKDGVATQWWKEVTSELKFDICISKG
jgi:hypothetical protein